MASTGQQTAPNRERCEGSAWVLELPNGPIFFVYRTWGRQASIYESPLWGCRCSEERVEHCSPHTWEYAVIPKDSAIAHQLAFYIGGGLGRHILVDSQREWLSRLEMYNDHVDDVLVGSGGFPT